MRKALIVLFFLVVVAIIIGNLDFGKSSDPRDNDSTATSEIVSKDDSIQEGDSIGNGKGLNDIRFANFTDKDWFDNEYIRSLRKYLDDYNHRKIKDKDLDPYKEIVRGKFVIGSVEPYLLGGLFIRIVFVDYPEDIFTSWVYSSVDISTETILDYSVRGISHEGKSEFTKEDVQQFLKENPEQKEW